MNLLCIAFRPIKENDSPKDKNWLKEFLISAFKWFSEIRLSIGQNHFFFN